MHRIGRSGRAGATGESHTLITPNDAPFAAELARMLSKGGKPLPRELLPFAGAGSGAGGGNRRCLFRGAKAGLRNRALRAERPYAFVSQSVWPAVP